MFIIPPIGKLIRRDVLLIQVVPTAVVFLVLLTFAIISWRSAETTLLAQKDQTIGEEMDSLEDAIQNRMQANEVLLRSGVGLFDGSEAVSREEWNRFYAKFDVQEQFTGVSTIGYAPVVPASDRSAFETTLHNEGFADSSITPAGDRPVYVPVMYFQRYSPGTTGPGFDMYNDPVRRTALDRAAYSGLAAMTDMVRLTNNTVPGVVLYMPVYARAAVVNTAEERQAALRGYVYTTLRLNELFSTISTKDKDLKFSVSETVDNKQQQLFSSANSVQQKSAQSLSTAKIDVFGQTWTVSLLSEGGIVSDTDNQRPSTILTAGIAISIIASVAVYLLIQFRTRSFALTEERKLQQAKDELLSLASHQLRTPATGVKQYVGMVLDGFGGRLLKGQVKLLEQAYKSNERQLQIINEFLYVAKLGSGSLTTAKHEFDMVSVVRDVTEEMHLDIKEKQHKIYVTTPKTAMVEADEHSVRMILENLLSNAIKYTPNQGHIEIVLHKTSSEVRVDVKDNGIGIAKKDMSLLFKQFSRIPNELSMDISGSGIGLYLSQQLAERNNGVVSVVSEPGKGSVFTFHLPIKSVRNLTKRRKKS